ncbi:hypothetical protein OR604_18410 [Aeromonas caviae]|uniref:hypothetical protein n=1 Tax=Aeromonas caviae TaxID=648 RepID=UPI00224D7F6E|nr:hypothetical protein [Aeromonas caviae]MCX4038159.1 hypothetical protein [Aeromonas caviae]
MSAYAGLIAQGLGVLVLVILGGRWLEKKKRADWSKKWLQWQVLLVVMAVLFMVWRYHTVTTQHKAEIEWKVNGLFLRQ